MAKLKLQPNPTFKAKASIPVAGGAPIDLEFTFKHRNREDLNAFLKSAIELQDAALIMACAEGWELEDAFTADNINTLAQNYITAPQIIFNTYLNELVKAREKN